MSVLGIDIVRRDYSQLSCIVGKQILDEILQDQTFECRFQNIQRIIAKTVEDLKRNAIPLHLLVINNKLNKPLESYNKQIPVYVQAARNYNKQFNSKLKQGDIVPYVVCLDETENNKRKSRLAQHVVIFKTSKKYKIDIDFYLNQEIYPIVRRLCSPIKGLEDKLNHILDFNIGERETESVFEQNDYNEVVNVDNFDSYEKFTFICPSCQQKNIIDKFLRNGEPALNACINVECQFKPMYCIPSIKTELITQMDGFVRKYEELVYECENKFCRSQTKNCVIENLLAKCNKCNVGFLRQLYTESDLNSQLMYFKNLFYISSIVDDSNFPIDSGVLYLYNDLFKTVTEFIENCPYSSILDLSKIFFNYKVFE